MADFGGGSPERVSRNRQSSIEPDGFDLTPRELDVLTSLAEGAYNKTIAKQLGISVNTAKFQRQITSWQALMQPAARRL